MFIKVVIDESEIQIILNFFLCIFFSPLGNELMYAQIPMYARCENVLHQSLLSRRRKNYHKAFA